jgi:hypothetical protein
MITKKLFDHLKIELIKIKKLPEGWGGKETKQPR